MICFGILRIFGKKSQRSKLEIWAYRAPTPQHREPTSRRRPKPRRGMPHREEVKVPKWHPSGTLRRSKATPQRSSVMPRCSYCS